MGGGQVTGEKGWSGGEKVVMELRGRKEAGMHQWVRRTTGRSPPYTALLIAHKNPTVPRPVFSTCRAPFSAPHNHLPLLLFYPSPLRPKQPRH